MPDHPIDSFLIFHGDTTTQVDAVRNFPMPLQMRYDPHSKIYNIGWRDHPNLSYGSDPHYNQLYQPRPPLTQQFQPLKTSLEAIVESYYEISTIEIFMVPPPFIGRLTQCKKEREEREILDTFRKVEINIPLLNAIKQVPRYAKFLKELCTGKKKLMGNEIVGVGENAFMVLQRKIPPKRKDQGMFAISCKIGNVGIKKSMCYLGAFINVMPLFVYKLLDTGHLKETRVIIQLVDRSIVYPEGVLEDVLVKVNELIFPTDFYIIKMEDDKSKNSSNILLGKPFLSTERMEIDVRSGTLTMEFDGEAVKLNVYEVLAAPMQ
ncbi:hypothetical protein EPI10_016509 [Gossypium australe]|uniref:Uncharacterized protein n=1 Tax=Gossypium australe TaxID=47621 RepID=A0A5B6VNT4_9ROSI|nr:hypothetical protein EPI10_016509 [Gossypium australe]